MADPSLRQRITLTSTMNADDIFAQCIPAVFKLYSYNARGELLGMGSGVVIAANGDAVTCGHLVNGVSRLVAEMSDGVKREVSVYDLDADADIAYIRVVGSNLSYLETCDTVQAGEAVYALGYPGGGNARITAGTVTDPANDDYLTPLIESTASVISGNSGGALVNSRGELVGITVSSQGSGSPSFSVPISALASMEGTTAVTPAEYTSTHRPDASRCYTNLYPVPDFGKVTGVQLYASTRDRGTTQFYYRLSDISDLNRTLLEYYAALNENTFYQFSEEPTPLRRAICCPSNSMKQPIRGKTYWAYSCPVCRPCLSAAFPGPPSFLLQMLCRVQGIVHEAGANAKNPAYR